MYKEWIIPKSCSSESFVGEMEVPKWLKIFFWTSESHWNLSFVFSDICTFSESSKLSSESSTSELLSKTGSSTSLIESVKPQYS